MNYTEDIKQYFSFTRKKLISVSIKPSSLNLAASRSGDGADSPYQGVFCPLSSPSGFGGVYHRTQSLRFLGINSFDSAADALAKSTKPSVKKPEKELSTLAQSLVRNAFRGVSTPICEALLKPALATASNHQIRSFQTLVRQFLNDYVHNPAKFILPLMVQSGTVVTPEAIAQIKQDLVFFNVILVLPQFIRDFPRLISTQEGSKAPEILDGYQRLFCTLGKSPQELENCLASIDEQSIPYALRFLAIQNEVYNRAMLFADTVWHSMCEELDLRDPNFPSLASVFQAAHQADLKAEEFASLVPVFQPVATGHPCNPRSYELERAMSELQLNIQKFCDGLLTTEVFQHDVQHSLCNLLEMSLAIKRPDNLTHAVKWVADQRIMRLLPIAWTSTRAIFMEQAMMFQALWGNIPANFNGVAVQPADWSVDGDGNIHVENSHLLHSTERKTEITCSMLTKDIATLEKALLGIKVKAPHHEDLKLARHHLAVLKRIVEDGPTHSYAVPKADLEKFKQSAKKLCMACQNLDDEQKLHPEHPIMQIRLQALWLEKVVNTVGFCFSKTEYRQEGAAGRLTVADVLDSEMLQEGPNAEMCALLRKEDLLPGERVQVIKFLDRQIAKGERRNPEDIISALEKVRHQEELKIPPDQARLHFLTVQIRTIGILAELAPKEKEHVDMESVSKLIISQFGGGQDFLALVLLLQWFGFPSDVVNKICPLFEGYDSLVVNGVGLFVEMQQHSSFYRCCCQGHPVLVGFSDLSKEATRLVTHHGFQEFQKALVKFEESVALVHQASLSKESETDEESMVCLKHYSLFLGAGGSTLRGFPDAAKGNGIMHLVGQIWPRFTHGQNQPVPVTLQSEANWNTNATSEVSKTRGETAVACLTKDALCFELEKRRAQKSKEPLIPSDHLLTDEHSTLFSRVNRCLFVAMQSFQGSNNPPLVQVISTLALPCRDAQQRVKQSPRPGQRPQAPGERPKNPLEVLRAIGFVAMQRFSGAVFSGFFGLHMVQDVDLVACHQLYEDQTSMQGRNYRWIINQMLEVASEINFEFMQYVFDHLFTEELYPAEELHLCRNAFYEFLNNLRADIAALCKIAGISSEEVSLNPRVRIAMVNQVDYFMRWLPLYQAQRRLAMLKHQENFLLQEQLKLTESAKLEDVVVDLEETPLECLQREIAQHELALKELTKALSPKLDAAAEIDVVGRTMGVGGYA